MHTLMSSAFANAEEQGVRNFNPFTIATNKKTLFRLQYVNLQSGEDSANYV